MAETNASCLKISVTDFPDFITIRGSPPHISVTGMMVTVFDILAQHFSFCYQYVVPADKLYGDVFDNGTATGIIGQVNRTEADFTGILGSTLKRHLAVDFSEPLFMDEFVVSYKRPVLGSDIAGFLKPYTPLVWLLIFLTTVLIFAATWLTLLGRAVLSAFFPSDTVEAGECHPAGGRLDYLAATRHTADLSAMWTVSILFCQDCPWAPVMWSVRVMTGLWMVTAFILSTVYRSNLKAKLITPRISLPFNNIHELVESKIPVFVSESNYVHQTIMAASEDSPFGQLRGQIFWNMEVPKVIRNTYAGVHATVSTLSSFMFIEHKVFSKTGKCGLFVMPGRILQSPPMSMAFQRGSPLKAKFDVVIRGLKEFGILDHLLQQWVSNFTECLWRGTTQTPTALRALELGDFYGLLSIYASGLVMGLLIFLVEVITKPKTWQVEVDPFSTGPGEGQCSGLVTAGPMEIPHSS
ncbi:glutamate receptor ionotropic, kainate 3-like [Homarus americanus]|uniref:glutamate receptor ionotropic, kainate 3-like n=1 Tax=Homarus americanus TaxID=6706 RepID=UPI001C46620F|nr:glutamate receptor ionotropic, kainate 3-like [Homarus americanus]